MDVPNDEDLAHAAGPEETHDLEALVDDFARPEERVRWRPWSRGRHQVDRCVGESRARTASPCSTARATAATVRIME